MRSMGGLRLWHNVLSVALLLVLAPSAVRGEDLSSQQIVFTIIAFVVGIIMCFFGYRLFKIMLFLSGFVLAGGGLYLLLESMTSLGIWPVIAISCAAGLCGGLLMIFLKYVSFFLLGAVGGVVTAIAIQTTSSGGLIHSDVGKWCFLGAMGLAGGIITLFLVKFLIVIFTSIGGAYASMIAVDRWTGGELSQAFREVFNNRNDEDLLHLSLRSKLFLGGAALMALSGIFVQFFVSAKNYHHDPDKREKLQTDREEKISLIVNGQQNPSYSAYNRAPPTASFGGPSYGYSGASDVYAGNNIPGRNLKPV